MPYSHGRAIRFHTYALSRAFPRPCPLNRGNPTLWRFFPPSSILHFRPPAVLRRQRAEFLVAEACRRQDYSVDFSLGRGADGGVDLTLNRDDRKSLVQCKQWKTVSVGAAVIREMFGLIRGCKSSSSSFSSSNEPKPNR